MIRRRTRGSMRFSIVAVLGVIGLVAIAGVMMMAQSTPEETARVFMKALGEKDVKTLTEVSYLESPKEDLAKQWDFCVNKAAKNAVFAWFFDRGKLIEGDRATIPITFERFIGASPTEEGPLELALIKVDGKWKVDLASTSRKFFPALPE